MGLSQLDHNGNGEKFLDPQAINETFGLYWQNWPNHRDQNGTLLLYISTM
ncbi:hypothetical protein Hanom_Chr03g00273471 [Helianthus anomalus]